MKNYICISITILITTLVLSSCSDDESYYKGDDAREALKKEWNVNSIEVKSGYPEKDEIPNFLLKTFILNSKSYTKKFDEQNITTHIEAKSEPPLFQPITFTDRYATMDNNLIIESSILGNQNIPYTFQVSNKKLVLKFKFNKEMFAILFQAIGENVDPNIAQNIQQMLAEIPDDYSGDLWLNLQR